MSEYGPEFFRNYLDRLDERLMTSEVVAPGAAGRAAGRADAERRDKSIEKNYKNDFLDIFYNTDEPKTLCPPGTKSAKCGSGNFDPENFRPPEDSPDFDPCPGKSQTLDPKTGKCVSVFGSMRDIIDRMQNDPMLQRQLKGSGGYLPRIYQNQSK